VAGVEVSPTPLSPARSSGRTLVCAIVGCAPRSPARSSGREPACAIAGTSNAAVTAIKNIFLIE
jgi:hypothetical protein